MPTRQFETIFLELDCFIDCYRALILCGHRSNTQKWIALLTHIVSLHKFQLNFFHGFQNIINVEFQN